ncbi:MAG: metallophosphoesterase, partial [Candidatus Portnoybacteria bacterium CG10_big_fil_rev_8_21_14_0_10_36_7]
MGNLRILFFGDVVGRPGRAALKKSLAHLKKEFKADFVIINAENLSHGKGVSEPVIKEMEKIGVDAFTSGNHIFAKKREAQGLLTVENSNLLRPANYPTGTVGEGYRVFEAENGKKILIVNLIGRVFMQRNFEDPFAVAGEILKEYGLKMSDANIKVDAIIIDWHTEASSEKKALGYYLDGKVSAVLGTHTHIPTADEQVLPEGTAFMA